MLDLIADRFALNDGSVIDLATGDRVRLTIESASGPADQARWDVRCEVVMRMRDASIARLVDYGCTGDTHRFEAWACDGIWTGSRTAAEQTVRRASRFLSSCGLTTGALDTATVNRSGASPVVSLDAAGGYSCQRPGETVLDSGELPGLVVGSGRAVAALAEIFSGATGARPQVVSLWGAEPATRSAAIRDLARAARLQGFVPVSTALMDDEAVRETVGGRSLFLIDDERGTGWAVMLETVVRHPRPLVLLFTGREEIRGVAGFPLGTPNGSTHLMRTNVRRTTKGASIAAEPSAVYGSEPDQSSPTPTPQTDMHVWPAPGELATLRGRLGGASRLLERGRHASGERLLRQTIGALARRHDWTSAGEGALALAGALLARGRIADAQSAAADARDFWRRASDHGGLVRAATIAGTAFVDAARLEDGERVLAAGLATARSRADRSAVAETSLAFARCLFWSGQYAEALRLCEEVKSGSSERLDLRAALLASRTAVGLREFAPAVNRVTECVARARTGRDQELVAIATCAAAFVHLAVGDLDACERDVRECQAAARTAHDPLRAFRAHVIGLEVRRRRGDRHAAEAAVRRIERFRPGRLPPIVRVRFELVRDLIAAEAPATEIVSRHVAATGLRALALLLPGSNELNASGMQPMVEGALDILRLCQDADDERAVLRAVCAALQKQLRAAGVTFVTHEEGALAVMASSGLRTEHEIARRAIDAGVVIQPHRCAERFEAAAPVKYGGHSIGAVVVRWTPGSDVDAAGAAAAIAMSATAAAPILAAARAHRLTETARGPADLLGESAAIADVRRLIERAARAPFGVLIEGESGSGKELVARSVHRLGPRRDRPFCALNCAALPDDLVEAELFGHARGAFTGSVAERPGVFEEAHGGTLFLDEIGELSLRAQAKVLRVVQEGELRRLGENVTRRIDVRIVAATNRDLRVEVTRARFRLDLLYRLDVVRIVVPPLRDRREDVAVLAEHFWREAIGRIGSRSTLSSATLAALARYDWPGNVRELQNVLAALAVRCPKRGAVPPSALPPSFHEAGGGGSCRLADARRAFDERFVRAALVRAGGHRARAADELGLSRQGLTKLMSRLGIEA